MTTEIDSYTLRTLGRKGREEVQDTFDRVRIPINFYARLDRQG